jgi:hypothetical protein
VCVEVEGGAATAADAAAEAVDVDVRAAFVDVLAEAVLFADDAAVPESDDRERAESSPPERDACDGAPAVDAVAPAARCDAMPSVASTLATPTATRERRAGWRRAPCGVREAVSGMRAMAP